MSPAPTSTGSGRALVVAGVADFLSLAFLTGPAEGRIALAASHTTINPIFIIAPDSPNSEFISALRPVSNAGRPRRFDCSIRAAGDTARFHYRSRILRC